MKVWPGLHFPSDSVSGWTPRAYCLEAAKILPRCDPPLQKQLPRKSWIDTYQQDRQVERLAIREFGLAPLRLELTHTATRPFGWE